MEKVFFVVGDDLKDVNAELVSGGRIKAISPVAETAAIAAGDDTSYPDRVVGGVFAYVVIEYPDNQ